ncbi:TetR/AcrR family transcriptional regulator [Halorarum halophilum]|uniref:TetR/AcrR family transcriptional regulator n=1 Tax=Halorarum halophilum TaxID=2743090 RepID=A0A7D5L2R6_9EURY|nr:TetR/AcrR family transcriptional regulator [Halobaculum halophilum]QLG27643.1 TetR/AcrR family transcriptional regulator [Halobaculum halophilum]
MPTFTDEKRAKVRESLRESGRELFARHGVRKTTISELTESAGIGTGTFYRFYDSKEDLYVDIVEKQTEALIPRLLRESVQKYDDPEQAIAALLDATFDEFESNPLLRQVIAEDEVSHLRDSVPDEELTKKRAHSMEFVLPHIENWYDEGKVIGPDPETIAETIRAVSRIVLQREQIGEERYPEVRDTLVAAVAAGLTDVSGSPGVSDE